MPDPLTTPQLEAIQRLITEPLRLTVRAEMQAGHERLAAAIEKVADRLEAHMVAALDNQRLRDARVDLLERRVATLERFRTRVLLVYGALTVLCSFAWSVLREWAVRQGGRR